MNPTLYVAQLANDDVVQSIGYGNTDKLSNLLAGCEITSPLELQLEEEAAVLQECSEENPEIPESDDPGESPLVMSNTQTLKICR